MLSVQVWTRNNYHWYLKQEVTSLSEEHADFLAVSWHPEKPMELAILSKGQYPNYEGDRSLVLTLLISLQMLWRCGRSAGTRTLLCSAHRRTLESLLLSTDVSLVHLEKAIHLMLTCPLPILLAASLLVTPFRTQNVPPPMSTTKLVTPHADRSIQPPIHVAFAPSSKDSETETFALLFGKEVHVRQVTSKLDRTQPGRVQSYTDAVVLPLDSTIRPRQVAVRADGEDGKAGEVVVLGWDTDAQCDALWFSTFGGEKASWEYMPLSSTGKANISSALGGFVFQTKEGDLMSCACLLRLVPLAIGAGTDLALMF